MPRLIAEGVPEAYFEKLRRERELEAQKLHRSTTFSLADCQTSMLEFSRTIEGRYLILLFQLIIVATIGAIFFKTFPQEDNMTWVDAFYFSVVTACAVGYGDITPQSNGGKIFSIPYMIFSTVFLGKLVAQFIQLYVKGTVGERITREVLNSVTYVYKADIDDDGSVSETDYVLFKLHQLQMIDRRIENELVKRFRALDVGGDGFLDVGIDVPSADQVRALEQMNLLGTERTAEAMEAWRRMRPLAEPPELAETRSHLSIASCHEFFWSPKLWEHASKEIAAAFFVSLTCYLIVGGLACYAEGIGILDSFYLFAQTVTSVGIGDLSPTDQRARASAILLIPLGIVVVSFGISYFTAFGLSRMKRSAEEEEAALKAAHLESVGEKKGSFHAFKRWLRNTDAGKFTLIFIKYAAVICSGALFFYFSGYYDDIDTPTDALFFATLIACTVGYGHKIWPNESGGKIFCIFYFFFASVVVGKLLHNFSVVYSLMGTTDDLIMDSILWVHLADLERTGKISEAGYILFKLRQMQRVDDKLIARICDRFHELDEDSSGTLVVGVDIPSGTQVKQMKEEYRRVHSGEPFLEQSAEIAKFWHKIRSRLLLDRRSTESKLGSVRKEGHIKLTQSHDFKWSTDLWNGQARATLRTACVALVLFFVCSFLSMWLVETEEMTALDTVYWSMATLATVGYGDFAPTRQLNRAMGIIIMPCGLIIIGVFIVYVEKRRYATRDAVFLDPRAGTIATEQEEAEEPVAALSPLARFAQTEEGLHTILVHEAGLEDLDHKTEERPDLWYWIEGNLERSLDECHGLRTVQESKPNEARL